MEFEFTIIADGLDPQDEGFEALFYDAGCDDALVSFQKGHILVDFAREAASLEEAIASAVEHVMATGATIERVEPDPLVSLADIAARSNMTRAAITNYFKGYRGENFPAPVARVTTASPLWDWSDVSIWLYRHGRVARDVAVGATVFTVANSLLGAANDNFRRCLQQEVTERVAAI